MKQVTIVSLLVSIVLCFSSCSQVEDYEWKEVDIKVDNEIGILHYWLFRTHEVGPTEERIYKKVKELYGELDWSNKRQYLNNKGLSKNVKSTMNKHKANVSATIYDKNLIINDKRNAFIYDTMSIPIRQKLSYEKAKGERSIAERDLAWYTEEIRKNPNNADLYFERGYMYAYNMEYDYENSHTGLEILSFLLNKPEYLERAISDWKMALRINPNHTLAKKYLQQEYLQRMQ